MAYTINKTDGTALVTVADGAINTTYSITLIGKNYAGYGEVLNENQIKLSENFANTTANAPASPLVGQTFYDTTTNQLKVYDGAQFKTTGSAVNSQTSPSSAAQGDLWYDTANGQLYVYSGSAWILVGPTSSSGGTTSGTIVSTVTDTSGVSQTYLAHTISDNVVAITAQNSFTPGTTITGFSTITAGTQISSTISGIKFTGTATDSDALGGIAAANYLRSNASDVTTGTLTIQNDASLVLGADGDVSIGMSSNDLNIQNTTTDGDINFKINDSGVTKSAIVIDGATGDVTTIANLNVTGNVTVSGTTTSVNTTNMEIVDPLLFLAKGKTDTAVDAGLIIDRGVSLNAGIIFDESADEFAVIYTTEDGTTAGNVAISSYANMRVTATSALYSDLAERYHADAVYAPGTLVSLGGEKEITVTRKSEEDAFFGVISTDPAFKMNANAGSDETHPFVALVGRVPVKVKGVVHKGQRIIVGQEDGIAETEQPTQSGDRAIVGRALEEKLYEDTDFVECVVGVK